MNSASQRLAVTGGSGFIGTNVVDYYQNVGSEVLNLDCSPPRNPEQHGCWRKVDLLESDELTQALRKFRPTMLFHLGARTDLDGSSVSEYAANTAGVHNLIAASRDLPSLERAIFASSRLVCRSWVHRPMPLTWRKTATALVNCWNN